MTGVSYPVRVAALALVIAMAAPAAAHAVRPAPGKYRGKVAGAAISFRVTTHAKLRSLRTGRVRARCDNGTREKVWLNPRRWVVSGRRGRYSSRRHIRLGDARSTVWWKTTFTSRRRARGTLRIRYTILRTGTVCKTGVRRFKVKRRSTAPTSPPRIFDGKTVDGSLLEIAMTPVGDAVRASRMRAKMQCSDGGTVTLDVKNPTGPDAPVTDSQTFSGSWNFLPPPIAGHAEPSGGGIQLSGRVTPTGLDGAARMTIGFMDGNSCDGGWQRFTIAGNTATG
jgi:hypothetical protein